MQTSNLKFESKSKNLSLECEYSDVKFSVDGQLITTQTPMWNLEQMKPNSMIKGPAIILVDTSTIVVDPDFSVFFDEFMNIVLTQNQSGESKHLLLILYILCFK